MILPVCFSIQMQVVNSFIPRMFANIPLGGFREFQYVLQVKYLMVVPGVQDYHKVACNIYDALTCCWDHHCITLLLSQLPLLLQWWLL